MGCIYSEYRTGLCQLYDGTIEMNGCDENGICICEDDDDPTQLCEDYQSNE